MRVNPALVLAAWLSLVVASAAAEARPVIIEARTAAGQSLGQIAGELGDRVVYFSLQDVAELVRGTVRRWPGGNRATLVARKKIVEVRRGSAVVLVDGRALTLGAPVRQRQGTWLVPGDLLVRALPALLGSGVQVSVASAPIPPRPVVRPVSTTAARAGTVPRPPIAPRPEPGARGAASDAEASGVPPRPAVAPPAPAPAEPARPAAVKAGVVELRYRSYPGYTRVVLEGMAPFEPRLIESGGALVVPLAGMSGPAPRTVRAVRDGLLDSLELIQSRGTPALRVTFEHAPVARKVFRLQDPPRLVLEFYRGGAAASARTGIATVVIDAGHGGHDSGAVGPGGLLEKDLTLDLARRVAVQLVEDAAVKVVLSRTRDQFVPLRERTAIANRHKADLFVSIHVNAASGATATGTETYFLSSEATDNAARAAAAFENKVIALEAGPRRDVLRTILWDLAQSEFQKESSRLAETLQDALDRALRLPSRGVKQAPFYVLGGAAMPAVLVEVGFISNPQEEQRLQDEGYRDRIARALAAGLVAYKRRYDQKGGVVAGR